MKQAEQKSKLIIQIVQDLRTTDYGTHDHITVLGALYKLTFKELKVLAHIIHAEG